MTANLMTNPRWAIFSDKERLVKYVNAKIEVQKLSVLWRLSRRTKWLLRKRGASSTRSTFWRSLITQTSLNCMKYSKIIIDTTLWLSYARVVSCSMKSSNKDNSLSPWLQVLSNKFCKLSPIAMTRVLSIEISSRKMFLLIENRITLLRLLISEQQLNSRKVSFWRSCMVRHIILHLISYKRKVIQRDVTCGVLESFCTYYLQEGHHSMEMEMMKSRNRSK